jgi:hypothetical protein
MNFYLWEKVLSEKCTREPNSNSTAQDFGKRQLFNYFSQGFSSRFVDHLAKKLVSEHLLLEKIFPK